MPLSEHEQRILDQIERGFYEDDPRSARRISTTTLPRYLSRNCRLASLGFVVGLLVLVASFATSWVIGLVGFLVMTGSAVALARNLRRYGRHGLQALAAPSGRNDPLRWMRDLRARLGHRGESEPD